MSTSEIYQLIPQRDPFLFVSEIVEKSESLIQTYWQITGEEYFFKGHFPSLPICPGVLLQEALFQTGALLIGNKNEDPNKIGVVTKVSLARFKHLVRPGDRVDMYVELTDQIDHAFFMKGRSQVNGKKVCLIEFSCALINKN